MAVLWRMALLVLITGLSLGQTRAQDGANPSGSPLASEIGVRWTQGDPAGSEAGSLSGVIESASERMTYLVETVTQGMRSRMEAFSGALAAGLGAVTLESAQRPGEGDSVPVDRLALLALGVMSVTGCITIAARRYWYNRFWQPECLEVSLRIRQLEDSFAPEEAEAALDLERRTVFWDAVPQPPTPKVALPDLEYLKMLVKLGYHRDAKRALGAIERHAIPAWPSQAS